MESFERYAGFLPDSGLAMIARDSAAADTWYDDRGPDFRPERYASYALPNGAWCDAVLPEVVEALPPDAPIRPGTGAGALVGLLTALPRRLAAQVAPHFHGTGSGRSPVGHPRVR